MSTRKTPPSPTPAPRSGSSAPVTDLNNPDHETEKSDVENSDIIPKDSPFRSSGVVDKFPVTVSAYTPQVRKIIVPDVMTRKYMFTLVYPGTIAWGISPNSKVNRAWLPLGYKRADVVCQRAKSLKAPAIVVGFTVPDSDGTIVLDACWRCQVQAVGNDCTVRNVSLNAKGEIMGPASIHDRPPLTKSSKAPPTASSKTPGPTAAAPTPDQEPPVPSSTAPKPAVTAPVELSEVIVASSSAPESAVNIPAQDPDALAESSTAPKPVKTADGGASANTTVSAISTKRKAEDSPSPAQIPTDSAKTHRLSALARKRKLNSTPPVEKQGSVPHLVDSEHPTEQKATSDDWIKQLKQLADTASAQIVPRSEHLKTVEALDRARKRYSGLELKLKTSESNLKEAQTLAETAQAAKSALDLEVQQLKARVKFFRSAASDTIKETAESEDDADEDLDQLDDQELWVRLAG